MRTTNLLFNEKLQSSLAKYENHTWNTSFSILHQFSINCFLQNSSFVPDVITTTLCLHSLSLQFDHLNLLLLPSIALLIDISYRLCMSTKIAYIILIPPPFKRSLFRLFCSSCHFNLSRSLSHTHYQNVESVSALIAIVISTRWAIYIRCPPRSRTSYFSSP